MSDGCDEDAPGCDEDAPQREAPPGCMPEAQYRSDYLDAESDGYPTRQFVEREVLPRVAAAIVDFGSGWACDLFAVHSREVDALLGLIEGKLRDEKPRR